MTRVGVLESAQVGTPHRYGTAGARDVLERPWTKRIHVLATSDGQAVPRAHDMQPDVILLDLMMPGMDGVTVSQRLRSDPSTATIPIIAMSAQHRLHATAALMSVNDRLAKPFDLATLYATVARWTTAS